ncbi:MAG: ATP-dependent DNA ligase, partial [Candidatus Dormibacteraeota bacterium]|nr:ATP-dependent DNA ligase [Candidatus Dormibacteraeota bacterium]
FEDVAAAARGLAIRVEKLDPTVATTAFMKEDRGGKVFIDSTRVGGATVVCAYSPRVRAGCTVSFPISWDDLDRVNPKDFTIHTTPGLVGEHDPWVERMPAPQVLPRDVVEEGHAVPLARVQAMHEGKRRARARRGDAT